MIFSGKLDLFWTTSLMVTNVYEKNVLKTFCENAPKSPEFQFIEKLPIYLQFLLALVEFMGAKPFFLCNLQMGNIN